MNDFITIIATGSTFFLALLIFMNPNKVNIKANYWFGSFITCIFIFWLFDVFVLLHLEIKNPVLIIYFSAIQFLVAPFFYFSIIYFIDPNRKWKKQDYLHFLVFIVYTSTVNFIYFKFGNSVPKIIIENYTSIVEIILNLIITFQFIYYFVIIHKIISNHKKNILKFVSSSEQYDLRWIEYLTYVVAFLVSVNVFIQYIPFLNEYYTHLNFIYLLAIFGIAFYHSQQKEIYPFKKHEKKEIIELINEKNSETKLSKKVVSDIDLESKKRELILIMENEKPYLDGDLNIIKLSKIVAISSHQLSYILNTGFNENFFQFINRYRIEEAKKIILNSEINNFSLYGIAIEVGFNSKSSFNTTFKKITQKTPSEFKKFHL